MENVINDVIGFQWRFGHTVTKFDKLIDYPDQNFATDSNIQMKTWNFVIDIEIRHIDIRGGGVEGRFCNFDKNWRNMSFGPVFRDDNEFPGKNGI